MIGPSNSRQTFGEMNFGNAQLGDKRRTRRLISIVDCMVRHPGGTLPDKFKSPGDLKALYRLCDCKTVTHAALLASHRQHVLAGLNPSERDILVLHDSTELDYTTHLALKDLGQIGNGHHRGYICHNSLAVDPQNRDVLGLLNQVLHQRPKVPKHETSKQRRERESRESRLWCKGVEPLPGQRQFVDICDQGADVFEFLAHEFHSGRRFVIRAAYDRSIFIGHDGQDQPDYLRQYASGLSALGARTVSVSSKREQKSPKKKGKKRTLHRKKRAATVHVAAAPVQVRPPARKSGEYAEEPLWIVRVWEPNPPQGQERLEWFLLTNEPVDTFEQACRVIRWYECRWIIEEYHKALKTGCGIENPQFATEQRLQPAIALLSIVALTLLSLRDASRRSDAKERLATELICHDYVEVLSVWRHKRIRLDWTVYDFFYALARLGGHQNRKCDGDPGWLVLWRGWTTLQAMIDGAQAIKLIRKCGQT